MIDPAILDLARLREIYEDDREGIRDLLDLAVETAQSQLEAIDSAIGSHNATDVRGAAHAIKGASLNVGAVETARVSAELENAAANSRWETISTAAAALHDALVRLAENVSRYPREG
jgi:HPt (histidine-containing phosphotransfer) domain-containing protein